MKSAGLNSIKRNEWVFSYRRLNSKLRIAGLNLSIEIFFIYIEANYCIHYIFLLFEQIKKCSNYM